MSNQSRRGFLKGILGLLGLAALPSVLRPPKPIDPNPPFEPVDPIIEIDGVAYLPHRLHEADFVPLDRFDGSLIAPEWGRLETVRFRMVNEPTIKPIPTEDHIPFYRKYT